MASIKLFSYNVEDDDGRLVISVEGEFAKVAIAQLHEEINSGNGWKFLSRLSPIASLNRLAQSSISSIAEGNDIEEETLDVVFNQGFADDYKGFECHIDQFEESLRALENEVADTPSPTTTKKKIPIKSILKATDK